MKIKFNKTPEQLELIRNMASKDRLKAIEAQQVFAALVTPVLNHVYRQMDTTKFLVNDVTFDAFQTPTLYLEPYSQVTDQQVAVWSQSQPGGLPTCEFYQPIDEVRFKTHHYDSAISWREDWVRNTRIDILGPSLERMTQEILVKTNFLFWTTLLAALSQYTDLNGVTQVRSVATPGTFTLDDYNKILTYFRRLNSAWNQGTPVLNGGGRPTDFVVSPEMMEKFRAMAYNAINTTGPLGLALSTSNAGSASTIALPEAQRAALYQSGGVPEFYGINLVELLEFGLNQPYANIFSTYFGSTVAPKLPSGGSETFSPSADEFILIIDANRQGMHRVHMTDQDFGTEWSMVPDEQYVKPRSKKVGMVGGIEIGYLNTDRRYAAGYIV